MRRRFVALDRDGTLIEGHEYLADPAKVALLPGAARGLRQLRKLGLGLVLVTNQSAVARGRLDLERLEEIHERLAELLLLEDLFLDGIYFCPHHPDDDCACRKPGTGLLERAGRELEFDPGRGFVIGDNVCDIELGEAVGATTFLVTSGYGRQVLERNLAVPDHIVPDLLEASRVIRGILSGEAARR